MERGEGLFKPKAVFKMIDKLGAGRIMKKMSPWGKDKFVESYQVSI